MGEGCGRSVSTSLAVKRKYVPRSATLRERLDFYSERKPNGCLEWTASDDGKAGYGKLRWQGRMQYAHRLAWEDANGPVPEGMELRHRVCDNPPCIDVDHLAIGTHAQNIADCFEHGRASKRTGEHNNSSRLTATQVNAIRRLHSSGSTGAALALQFGVSQSQISNIVNNHHWKECA